MKLKWSPLMETTIEFVKETGHLIKLGMIIVKECFLHPTKTSTIDKCGEVKRR